MKRADVVVSVGLLALLAAVALIVLAASSGGEPSAADRASALAFVSADQAPLDVEPVAMWTGRGLVCGEVHAPALPRDRRFMWAGGPYGITAVEKDESWSGASDPRGDEILYESRVIFGKAWADNCAAYAPIGQRLAGWFGHSGDSSEGNTPLTNSYADELLHKQRH